MNFHWLHDPVTCIFIIFINDKYIHHDYLFTEALLINTHSVVYINLFVKNHVSDYYQLFYV